MVVMVSGYSAPAGRRCSAQPWSETEAALEDARVCVERFHQLLEDLRQGTTAEAALAQLRRDVGNLRLLFAGGEPRVLDLILQRFANYLALLGQPALHHLHDLTVFVDLLEAAARGELKPPSDEAEFARSLPVMRPADLDDLACLKIEVLLVDPQRTSARLVARELQNCGFRIVIATRSYEALEIAARTRPDLIISSAVLDEIDGVDLAGMLRLARATAGIPFALLTSLDLASPELRRLPPDAAVIRKDGNFADDLALVLGRLGLV